MKNRLKQKRLKELSYKPYLAEVVDLTIGDDNSIQLYPFKEGDTVLVLGEIEQMPGHVAITNENGLTYFGYHIENFRKLTRDES
jgi:hypothetical protein